jgi:dihydrofolate reductase
MRQIMAHLEMSLDGCVEAPEEWAHSYFIPEMIEATGVAARGSGTVLFGRKTYEQFAAMWPHRDPDEEPFAGFLNASEKLIVSNTLKSPQWGPADVISGDIEGALAELKGKPGDDMLVLGSLTLVGSLLRARLLDTLDLFLCPLLVGKGRRLFESDDQVPLKLTDSRPFTNGVLRLRYEPAV